MYAAESGAAVAMDYLRKNFVADGVNPYTSWGNYCVENNAAAVDMSKLITSSDVRPGLA